MKEIWLVNPYGPIEGEKWREYSFNQFGKFLSINNFKVIWWTASFSHHFKKYRSNGWHDIVVNANYTIRLVPTSSYKRNYGLGRLFKDLIFAKNAFFRFKKMEKPDLIVCATNPLLFGYPEMKYAKKHSIPIILDQMDLWPEFLEQVTRKPLNYILHFLLLPVYMNRKKNYFHLNGAMALGKNYLNEVFNINPVLKTKPYALVYNGIDVNEFRLHLNDEVSNNILQTEKKQGDIWCIFAGTLGPSYDINTILQCAYNFSKNKIDNYKFIIAGSGPLEGKVMEASKKLNNIMYIGKLLPEELIPVYGKCDVGLAAYSQGSNVDMPDKFYDYTAAGLVTLNSLKGEIQEYINEYNCGFSYEAGKADSLFQELLKLSDREICKHMKENSMNVGMIFDKNLQNEKLLNLVHTQINMELEL